MTALVWLSWVGVELLLGAQVIPARKRLIVCRGHAILDVEGALSHVRLVVLLDLENWIIEVDLILVRHCQVGLVTGRGWQRVLLVCLLRRFAYTVCFLDLNQAIVEILVEHLRGQVPFCEMPGCGARAIAPIEQAELVK